MLALLALKAQAPATPSAAAATPRSTTSLDTDNDDDDVAALEEQADLMVAKKRIGCDEKD